MPWCHLFLMTPLFGLAVFLVLPIAAAMPVYLLLSAISLFIYAKIMRALGAPVAVGREGLVGREALVASNLHPKGLVRYRGELWTATCKRTASPGDRVRIVAVHRNTLLVEPCPEGRDLELADDSHGDPDVRVCGRAACRGTSPARQAREHRDRRHAWRSKILTT